MAGKGSKYRPVDRAKWDEGYERVFGKREPPATAAPTYDQIRRALAFTQFIPPRGHKTDSNGRRIVGYHNGAPIYGSAD